MLPRTMSVKEAASHFNVLPCTVRSWIISGRLAAIKIGKQYFIPEAEVETMLLADKPKPVEVPTVSPVNIPEAKNELAGLTRKQLVADFVNGVRISVPAAQIWESRRQRSNRRRSQLERCSKCQ